MNSIDNKTYVLTSDTTITAGTNLISTAGNLSLPTTSGTTAGTIQINGAVVLRQNDAVTTTIFLGGAGAASTACQYGTGVGYQAMGQLTASMDYMKCVGYRARYTATFNSTYATYIGAQAGGTGGKYSTCIGYNAGSNSANNSHNVYINNVGASEEHVIRIGTYGSGENQQNLAYIAGVVHGSNGLVADTGDIVATSGNLKLPTTSSTVGQIQINSVRWLHSYGNANNVFVGSGAGNFTCTSAGNNTGVGYQSLQALSSGAGNSGIGLWALYSVTTGSYNSGCSYQCMLGVTTGSYNTAYGHGGIVSTYAQGSGSLWASNAVSNIAIGHLGVNGDNYVTRIGTPQSAGFPNYQTSCYIAGIYGVTPGGTKNIALIDSNGQLGSTATLAQSYLTNGMTWNNSTSTPVTAAVNNEYTINTASGLTTINLPATYAVNDRIKIVGSGVDGWTLVAASGDYIHHDTLTTSAGGSLSSTNRYNCVEIVCNVANAEWVVVNANGTLTVA